MLIIRPHRLHAMHKTWSIARDAARLCLSVGLCVCLLVTRMCCAKMAELIQMPFGGLTLMVPKNHMLDGGQDRTGRIHLQP